LAHDLEHYQAGVGLMNAIPSQKHVAYHESGHFVAQIVLQPVSHISRVSIIPDDDEGTCGAVYGEDIVLWEDNMPPRERIEAQIICLLSGFAAERKYDPSEKHRRLAMEGASRDFEKAINLCEIAGISLEESHLKARSFVDERWNEIICLTEALLIVKEFIGEEAEIWLDYAIRNVPISDLMLDQYPNLELLMKTKMG
jgi:hypothetical protein